MKQKQIKTAKRAARPGVARTKKRVVARRPLHKRVLLHPFSVMVLLCAGVLIIGTTLRSFAAPSYEVTATVPAQPPTQPAVISYPTNAQHVATASVTVAGTCPTSSYVKLYRNSVFSGVAQCVSQAFQIQTSLSEGANQLDPQVYNLTNQAGPPGTPVTVYFDNTSQTPPSAPADVPTTMWVSGVESGSFSGQRVQQTSPNPTVSGWAPPYANLTITFHSNPETCYTQATAEGWWTCTLSSTLPAGLHNVFVVAVTTSGQKFTFPPFQISVVAAKASLLLPGAAGQPLHLEADYAYHVFLSRQACTFSIGLSGGSAPYKVTADWGDGTTTSLDRADTANFTISHAYPTPSGANKSYTVMVRAVDAKAQSSVMQLSVVVKGDGIVLIASTTTFGQFLDTVHTWLWLIWPTYVVVMLMAIGYYLGEREEYQHLLAKRRAHALAKRK